MYGLLGEIENIVLYGDGSSAVNYRGFTARSYNVKDERFINILNMNGFDRDWKPEDYEISVAMINKNGLHIKEELFYETKCLEN